MAMRTRGPRCRFEGLRGLAAILLLASHAVASPAAGLQVAPVGLSLQADQQADGLWLSNTGQAPMQAQVRVFRWTQEDGQERFEPTRELIVSPPMLQLQPQGRQLVRVIRNGAPGLGAEEAAYRVVVDELPVSTLPAPGGAPHRGVDFVMRHLLPVFTWPAGDPPGPPALQWALRRDERHGSHLGQAVLEVSNTGGTHAQLADLVFAPANGAAPVDVHGGLLGYVLPGATMRWTLKLPPRELDAGGQWQVMLNGKTGPQAIPPIDLAR